MNLTHFTELQIQGALFDWARIMAGRYPELGLMYHCPNGGHRDKREAAKLKWQGVKPGVPDVCLPVARGGYNGLYIELKAQGGRLSPEQRAMLDALFAQGYRAAVCRSFMEARDLVERYLDGAERVTLPGETVDDLP